MNAAAELKRARATAGSTAIRCNEVEVAAAAAAAHYRALDRDSEQAARTEARLQAAVSATEARKLYARLID